MSELHFIRPLWLWAFVPYLLLLGLLLRHKLNQGNWAQVCDAELLPYLLLNKPSKQRRWPQVTLALAGLLSIAALAGPTWERLPAPAFRNTAALVIALDLSRSMDAEDIKPSRLIRARYKIADILKRRKDGQTALLVYADEAFTVTPLTDDIETINSQLSALNTDIMPSGGNDTATALQRSAELLKQAGLQQGQILLVTDDADADEAIGAAKQLGAYQLSILAVGTEEGAPIKSPDGGFVKDDAGNIIVPKLHREALQRLAEAGGGILQLLSDDDSDVEHLQSLFERQSHDQQQQEKNSDRLMDQWQDRGPWLLLLVLPLAALTFRRGLLCIMLMLLLPLPKSAYAFSWQDLWRTPDQQAQQAFQHNDYQQAAERFADPRWKAAAQYKAGQYEQALETVKEPQSADDYYNRANALAKKGQLPEAVGAYDKALQLDPKHEDARYNKDIVEKALQQQQQQNQQAQGKQQKDQQDQNKQQNGQQNQNDNQQAQNGEQQQDRQQQGKGQQDQQQQAQQNSSEQDKKTEKEAAHQQQAEQQQQDKTAGEQMQAGKEQPDEKHQAEKAEQQALAAEQKPHDEQQQADEQWLNRIPDDPSGLLRRKFAYQYQQRGRDAQERQPW